jgi:hypothetical protein
MSRKVQIVLGATAMEITPEPVASNTTELLAKDHIASVYNVKLQKKPSTADVKYLTAITPFTLGQVVRGVTSGATGVVYSFIGTVGLNLVDVVGEFIDGESLIYNETYVGVGVAAAPGTWNGVTGATSGAGVGISFDVTDITGVYDTITIVDPGTGYLPGDTVTILGADLGGATPANNLVITISGDTATVDGDMVKTYSDDQWKHPHETMTVLVVHMDNNEKFDIELQDVTNQATWSTGTLAGQNAAEAAINAWL